MSTDQIVVTVVGALLVAGIVWFFWLKKAAGIKAPLTSSGYQEVTILVKGGYTPGTIRVERGTPVRLLFRREETSPCSEQVVLDAFGKNAHLPEGQLVPVEFLPKEPGEYPFTCGMGMLRGTVVVE
ncbi:MAG: cupredoxin domain-containing protein [Actinomycetota bacterium]|nr:cupredoxin domain-containing protein [Kineosporiaceae bacterium SCSIO 59966]